jgi:hypothetical protein
MMDKLKELFELCAGSVTVIHNEHKDFYQTVEQFLNDQERNSDDGIDLDDDVRKFMVDRNHMITLHAYPKTPIGFYTVYHWDLLIAVDKMLDAIKKELV